MKTKDYVIEKINNDASNWFKTFLAIIAGLPIALLGVIAFVSMVAFTGCAHTKKSTISKMETVEKASMTNIEYRTNTIYTDTGSITTYYRDSLIFTHDTVIQPIERIVNRWFKQEVKHDTFNFYKTDTLIIRVKETVSVKNKAALPMWFWLFALVVSIIAIYLIIKGKR